METAEVKPKSSSMFSSVEFDGTTGTLICNFVKGGAYAYANFDPKLAEEFLAADSRGKWYHAHHSLFTNGVKVSQAEPTHS
jgi:hypothetical protein